MAIYIGLDMSERRQRSTQLQAVLEAWARRVERAGCDAMTRAARSAKGAPAETARERRVGSYCAGGGCELRTETGDGGGAGVGNFVSVLNGPLISNLAIWNMVACVALR
jgi:hypothetical protein